MASWSIEAVLALITWSDLGSLKLSSTLPPESVTSETTCGATSLPPFSIADVTMAIWRGVAWTSNWPIPVCATWSTDIFCDGYLLAGRAVTGVAVSLLKPSFSAIARILSWPSLEASSAKTLLQDSRSAVRTDTLLQPSLPASLGRAVRVPGIVYAPGMPVGASMSETRPFSMAAAMVTSLKVEPGACGLRSATFSIALPWSAESSFQACSSVAPVIRPGSKDGLLTIARIWPVAGSMATAEPCLPCSAS